MVDNVNNLNKSMSNGMYLLGARYVITNNGTVLKLVSFNQLPKKFIMGILDI